MGSNLFKKGKKAFCLKKYNNFIYLLMTDLIIKGTNLIIIIFFSKKLSIPNYGLLSLLTTYLVYTSLFVEFGTSHVGMREIASMNTADKKTFFINVVSLKFLLSILISLIFFIFSFSSIDIKLTIAISLTILLTGFLNDWYFKAHYLNKELFISYLTGLFAYVYLLFVETLEIFDYFAIRIFFLSITIIFMYHYIFRNLDLHIVKLFRCINFGYIYENIVKNSLPLFISMLAVTIYYNSDVILLQYIKGSYDVGIYSAYYKIVFVFLTLKAVITGYLMSNLSILYKQKKYSEIVLKIRKITFFLLFGIILAIGAIYLFRMELISWTFGSKYIVQGSDSLLLLLLTTVVITYAYILLPTYMIVSKHQNLFMKFTIMAALSNILINLVVIPKFGFLGAALSTVASEMMLFVLFTTTYKRFMAKSRYANAR